jgi:hypothetical protein
VRDLDIPTLREYSRRIAKIVDQRLTREVEALENLGEGITPEQQAHLEEARAVLAQRCLINTIIGVLGQAPRVEDEQITAPPAATGPMAPPTQGSGDTPAVYQPQRRQKNVERQECRSKRRCPSHNSSH